MRISAALLMLFPATTFAHGLDVDRVGEFRGEAGETLVIEGRGFDAETRVSFGPIESARVVRVTSESIVVIVPPGDGTVDVCVSSAHELAVAFASYRYGGESVLDRESDSVVTCEQYIVEAPIDALPIHEEVTPVEETPAIAAL